MKEKMSMDSALKTLEATLPITLADLKTKFRETSKRLHPDITGKDTTDEFVKAKSAYDFLCSRIGEASVVENVTEDGTLLSDLGLGLGPTINGKPCTACDSKGYQQRVADSDQKACLNCWNGITSLDDCRDCKGTGEFELLNKRKVPCKKCKGTGQFKTAPHRCKKCGGRGVVANMRKMYFVKCFTCMGTGELLVLNPVIPKGRLMFMTAKGGA